MPRTTLRKEIYMKNDLGKLIEGRKHDLGIYNADLGRALHLHYNTIGKRIENGEWTRENLVNLFEFLEFTDEEILRVMRKKKYELRRVEV